MSKSELCAQNVDNFMFEMTKKGKKWFRENKMNCLRVHFAIFFCLRCCCSSSVLTDLSDNIRNRCFHFTQKGKVSDSHRFVHNAHRIQWNTPRRQVFPLPKLQHIWYWRQHMLMSTHRNFYMCFCLNSFVASW